MDCIFCKISRGEMPSRRVFENNKIFAFLDINPVSPGHTLVIPKDHYDNLSETPDDLAKEIIVAAKKIAPAIIKAVGAKAYNLTSNVGKGAGQVIFHTHFHIIPRFFDDKLKLWPASPYKKGEAEKISEKIKSECQNIQRK